MEDFTKLGAVAGTHILFKPPRVHVAEYVNRKSTFSVLLQGAMDHRRCFIDVEFGYSEENHDSSLFKQSGLRGAMDKDLFIAGNPRTTICGVSVPPLLVVDAAYPIRGWLMKPYGGCVDDQKEDLDLCLSRPRNVV